ncbi:MAG: hypothetical protein ACRDTT_32420, partial [Pseudonocardiaceae bacterium]
LVHRDSSYLAKIERGDRNIPADLASDCDRALNSGGMLVRLHAVVAAGDGQQVIPTPGDVGHVAKQSTHVADEAPLGVSSEGQGAPIGIAEEISVPARTAEGRIIFVRVSRRVFLGGVGASAVGITLPPTAQAIAAVPKASSDDVNPLEHFVEMKKVLADSDNLFGPARVINAVHQQIEIMQHLRQSWRGADRQRLLQVQTQYADLLGWLYQDSGDFSAARHWVDRSLEWSHLARDSQTTAFILARQSHLAADLGNPADAIDAAEAARATARPNTPTAALAATFAGQGYALWGDAESASRSYDQARELLLRGEADHENAYGLCFNGFNEGYLDVYRARSLTTLGHFRPAAEVFQTAIEGLPEG